MKSTLNILLLLIQLVVYNPLALSDHITFRPQTMNNGLSNFVVTSFYKDSTGFMWIGTDCCLDRFDGVEFRHYTFPEVDLNKTRVRAITETTRGKLYVGNSVGLWFVNQQSNLLEQISPDIINSKVNALHWDGMSRNLLIGTDKGLFIMNEFQEISFVQISNNILSKSNSITGIVTDENGIIWLATQHGLGKYQLKHKKLNIKINPDINPGLNNFNKLTRIENTLYLGTFNAGLVRFEIKIDKFSRFTDVGNDIITDISSNGRDMLYVATDGNGIHFISHITHEVQQSFLYDPNEKSGIRSNSIYSLLVDRNGIIWVGFYQAGFDYSLYQNNIFKTYQFPPYFDSYGLPVRSFIVREKEKLIGTREGLFFINEAKNQFKSFKRDVLRSNLILSMKYHQGEYYIGTYGGGASILNPKSLKIRSFSTEQPFVKGHIFHFEEDSEGRLWLATSDGLFSYEKKTNQLKHFSSTNSQLLQGNVYYIFFDSTKKGWIATENGLNIYDPVTASIKNDVFPANFFNRQIIKVIYEDSLNRIFFCPDRGNILVSDPLMRNFSELELTKRFEGRIFLSVLEDANNRYWFGSDKGLININSKTGEYQSYGFAEGIPDNIFTTDAIFQEKASGKLWFGNSKGLLYVDTMMINNASKTHFPLIITDFNVNGSVLNGKAKDEYEYNQFVKLKYNQNNLRFRFVSLSFTDPASINYEFKLEGYDENWQLLTGGNNEVIYNKLPFGKYSFRVRTEGNYESEAIVQISIGSFFNLTFWIILVLILALLYVLANKLLHYYKKLIDKIAALTSSLQKSLVAESNRLDEKYRSVNLNEMECNVICIKLTEYMETDKPFTNPDMKILDLSNALNIHSHTLSYVFNQYLKKNYYDFVNEYRVEEFKKMIVKPDSTKYTLSAMAEKCGFSSRASFFRSFKKLTGITPNEYIRSVGINISDVND